MFHNGIMKMLSEKEGGGEHVLSTQKSIQLASRIKHEDAVFKKAIKRRSPRNQICKNLPLAGIDLSDMYVCQ